MDVILLAINQQKSGKAAWPNNIPPEALKQAEDINTFVLHLLFIDIWERKIFTMIGGRDTLQKYLKREIDQCQTKYSTESY